MKSQEQDHSIQMENVMKELSRLKDVTDICKESALKECPKQMDNSNDESDIATKVYTLLISLLNNLNQAYNYTVLYTLRLRCIIGLIYLYMI